MDKPRAIQCPLCNDAVDKLLYRFHLDSEQQVIRKINEQNPGWSDLDGICSRCIDYYHTELVMQQRMLPEIGPHFPVRSADDFVILPTGLRVDADQRFTGKGVTICFIDSGFYPHPDLTTYKTRIKSVIDVTNNKDCSEVRSSGGELGQTVSWHGTMTSVVCAGDGYLSKGLYKGIACDAELVLLKVQDSDGHITTANIAKALKWVLKHHSEYGIRIVNMSISSDESSSFAQSEVDQLAEQLIKEGVIVVAAAGNDEAGIIRAPASSPNVIAVGGVDDGNSLDEFSIKLYHSTYGKTADQLMKPELMAHAIWIAAPILPGTNEQKESGILHDLLQLNDTQLLATVQKKAGSTQIDDSILLSTNAGTIKESIRRRIQTCKYISPHYMHVDGTSFAAPIVSAIIAQLLEINPCLSPGMIRAILFKTAKRLKNWPAERQGFGMIQAKQAVLKVLTRTVMIEPSRSPQINRQQKTIGFYVQHDHASQITLAGTFNQWQQDMLLLEPGWNGLWKIEIPLLPAGRYYYKFFVDDRDWMEDVNNPSKEPDGFNGFNSILMIEE